MLLAGESAAEFGDAIRIDDRQNVSRLLGQPTDIDLLARHGTRTALHSCGGCDQTFADVESYSILPKGKKTETKTSVVVKQVRVSPEMLTLLRRPPSSPAAGDEVPVQHGIDEPAALEARDL